MAEIQVLSFIYFLWNRNRSVLMGRRSHANEVHLKIHNKSEQTTFAFHNKHFMLQ